MTLLFFSWFTIFFYYFSFSWCFSLITVHQKCLPASFFFVTHLCLYISNFSPQIIACNLTNSDYNFYIFKRGHTDFGTSTSFHHIVDNHSPPSSVLFGERRKSLKRLITEVAPDFPSLRPPYALTSPCSASSPNGATFSCFWASSWWSWRCCPGRDTRRGFLTSSASSASQTPQGWQDATTRHLASPGGTCTPTCLTFQKLSAMEMRCPTALRRPL